MKFVATQQKWLLFRFDYLTFNFLSELILDYYKLQQNSDSLLMRYRKAEPHFHIFRFGTELVL